MADLQPLIPTLLPWLRGGRFGRLLCELFMQMKPAPREVIAPLLDAMGVDSLALAAARALWAIEKRSEPLLPVIERIFDEETESVCDFICDLGPVAAPLLPKLIAVLGEEDWDTQWAAADALGAVASSDPPVIAALIDALGHASHIVRSAAARALAKTGSSAVAALRKLLGNSVDPRRSWAAFALGEMGAAAAPAVPELLAGMREDSAIVSDCCAIALVQISGEAEALPHLISILQSDRPDAPRRSAARALSLLGPSASVASPALEALVGDEDFDVHSAALEALQAIGSPVQ